MDEMLHGNGCNNLHAKYFLYSQSQNKLQFNLKIVAQKKNKRVVLIAVLFTAALLVYLLKPVLFDSKSEIPKPEEKTINMEPQFAKEGLMAITTVSKDTIKVVEIEIADNDPERSQGMMYRSSMSYDRAMLFIMEYEREQSFWMRNTKMSLDILYVNGNQEIVTIYKHTQPYSQSPIPSFKRAKYVVETAAGFCDKFGIEEGNLIAFQRVD
jgi:uncharacterized membrane protein (UPF0127 family)